MMNPTKKIKKIVRKIVFYDLETNGVKPFYKSAIMQIALKTLNNSLNESIYVYPYDNLVGATEIHGISSQTLKDNKAIKANDLINYLLNTFDNKSVEYYFLAYNNFAFDQNVLENHFKHFKLNI